MHASFAFSRALESFLNTKKKSISITNKIDNDDLDVTKGCEIGICISSKKSDLNLNTTYHNPQIFIYNTNKIQIFAGKGVGVVTKKGLKIEQNLPAINPTPLQVMKDIFQKQTQKYTNLNIFCTISVKDGEKIATQTANAKVGVIGGISILGTTGFVKPISNSAYLDSIKSEIKFAKANGYQQIVLTLGNSSLAHAKTLYNEESIVEIGNFVHEAIKIATHEGFNKAVFICGIGKLVKVSQGHKNTHNRFGSIDFISLQSYIYKEFKIKIDIKDIKTVKGIVEYLKTIDKKYPQIFYDKIKSDALYIFKEWNSSINLDIIQV